MINEKRLRVHDGETIRKSKAFQNIDEYVHNNIRLQHLLTIFNPNCMIRSGIGYIAYSFHKSSTI